MIKEVHVSVKRLVNLGNYENVTYECSTTSTIEEHETPTSVYEDSLAFCKHKVGIELNRFDPKIPIPRYSPPVQDDEIPF